MDVTASALGVASLVRRGMSSEGLWLLELPPGADSVFEISVAIVVSGPSECAVSFPPGSSVAHEGAVVSKNENNNPKRIEILGNTNLAFIVTNDSSLRLDPSVICPGHNECQC